MKKATWTWYTPEEKKPENGKYVAILTILENSYIIQDVSYYDGFNRTEGDDGRHEIFPTYWADPKIDKERWM